MKVYFKPTAFKQQKRLPKSEIQKIERKIEALREDPYSGKLLKGEFEGLYSLKAWPYRIVYEIKQKKIIILSIANRQGAYRKF